MNGTEVLMQMMPREWYWSDDADGGEWYWSDDAEGGQWYWSDDAHDAASGTEVSHIMTDYLLLWWLKWHCMSYESAFMYQIW